MVVICSYCVDRLYHNEYLPLYSAVWIYGVLVPASLLPSPKDAAADLLPNYLLLCIVSNSKDVVADPAWSSKQ